MSTPFRIAILSDLHNEFERGRGPARPTQAWFGLRKARRETPGHPEVGPLLTSLPGAADLVVLAGDIDTGLHGVSYADAVAKFTGTPVAYVMGNHEAYGYDMAMQIPQIRDAAAATEGRVTFLENDAVAFDLPGGRLHVLGCTLWKDYRVNGEGGIVEIAMRGAAAELNDHLRITLRGSRFQPEHARQLHDVSRKWLAREFARIRSEDAAAKVMVVTHHSPIPDGSHPQFHGDRLAPAFCNNMRSEIYEWSPLLWCFGHTHWNVDTMVGDTRVVANQRCYPGVDAEADTFLPKIIEVGGKDDGSL